MPDEESREVAEVLDALLDIASLGPHFYPVERLAKELVETVRKDERRRLGVEEGWERGVI